MNEKTQLIQPEQIEQAVLLIRGQRVMLDRDLAALYGVTTGNLNKAVQRNADRFPSDFMFQLTADEAEVLRFHFGSLKQGHHFKYLPFVFTQEGVAMLSSVLRSPRAAQVNIAIMRVFVRLRETLALHKDLAQKLAQLERKIEGHDTSIRTLFDAIRQLMTPPEKPRAKSAFTPSPRTLPFRAKRKPDVNEARHLSSNNQLTTIIHRHEKILSRVPLKSFTPDRAAGLGRNWAGGGGFHAIARAAARRTCAGNRFVAGMAEGRAEITFSTER